MKIITTIFIILILSTVVLIFSLIKTWIDSRRINELFKVTEEPLEITKKNLQDGFNQANSNGDWNKLLIMVSYINLRGQSTINKLTFSLLLLTFVLIILTAFMILGTN